MGASWEKGMWFGKMFASDEHILSTSTGTVARSAAVKAHPRSSSIRSYSTRWWVSHGILRASGEMQNKISRQREEENCPGLLSVGESTWRFQNRGDSRSAQT